MLKGIVSFLYKALKVEKELVAKVSIFDFTLHEVKTVWLPILILGYVLRSWRLLLLALTPMLFEILVGFGFLYFVSLSGLTISYYALMIMLMLIMALSWDYALFMLTRYKAEREAGQEVEEAVIRMVASSGSIVVVSGVVLSICWSVMLGLPEMFKTFGIAAASAIMVCAASHVDIKINIHLKKTYDTWYYCIGTIQLSIYDIHAIVAWCTS